MKIVPVTLVQDQTHLYEVNVKCTKYLEKYSDIMYHVLLFLICKILICLCMSKCEITSNGLITQIPANTGIMI